MIRAVAFPAMTVTCRSAFAMVFIAVAAALAVPPAHAARNAPDQSVEHYQQMIARAKSSANPQVAPVLYYRLGIAYSLTGDYRDAGQYVGEAIKKRESGPAGKRRESQPVPKAWYVNYFVILYKLGDYKQANDLARILIAGWPDDHDFWIYYANTFLLMHDERSATAVYALMYKRGLLTAARDYVRLASLYLGQNAPYKAATLLAEGMDKKIVPKTGRNYALLASAWTQAKVWDRALVATGHEIELTPSGIAYLQQASLYLRERNYAAAKTAAHDALRQGGLQRPGQAWMLVGQAAFRAHNSRGAIEAFNRASNFKSERQDAMNWIKYIQVNAPGAAGE